MDAQAAKLAQIENQKCEAIRAYPQVWAKLIAEWQVEASEDRVWLLYAANYLFQTKGVRWAIDPLTLHCRLPQAPAINPEELASLRFVLLTHRHADHFDPELIGALSAFPITWVIPEMIYSEIKERLHLYDSRVLIPKIGERLQLYGHQITIFAGQHWEKELDLLRGVPAASYLVEFGEKRLLFPGDTRTYDASKLPSFGPLDMLFAHLWLGRRAALIQPPPLLELFCRFCKDLKPRQLVLTHIREFGREPEEYWDLEHTQMVSVRWGQIAPETPVQTLRMGESIQIY